MHRIMQTLHDDHINVTRLLDLMESVFADIKTGNAGRLHVIHGAMQYMTAYPDMYHHPTEDVVFQRLISRSPETRPKVEALFVEHELIGAAGTTLRQALKLTIDQKSDPSQDLIGKAQDYIGSMRDHMNIEEGEIFPLAKVILTTRDWQLLDDTIAAAGDPLFGPQLQKSYQDLAKALSDKG